jgi:hypothetical protein
MMITCSIGVAVAPANAGAMLPDVKAAAVTRQHELCHPVLLFMIISKWMSRLVEGNERVFDPPHDLHRRELQRGVGQESDL